MTPLDAQNLKLIFDNYQLPICNIVRTSDNPSLYAVVLQNIFLENSECTIYERQSLSISFLSKQGLVEFPSSLSIHDDAAYFKYEQCDEMLQIQNQYPDYTFQLQKRLVKPTPLGVSFLDICCPD